MPLMEIDRRRFLALLAPSGASALGPGAARARSAADAAAPLPDIRAARYLAARKHAGRFEAALFDGEGRD